MPPKSLGSHEVTSEEFERQEKTKENTEGRPRLSAVASDL
jgi:hypothetical protein